ncbi:MAG: hypothetical protein Q9216_004507 [Gyalolechia sp. 2 TL-2023]
MDSSASNTPNAQRIVAEVQMLSVAAPWLTAVPILELGPITKIQRQARKEGGKGHEQEESPPHTTVGGFHMEMQSFGHWHRSAQFTVQTQRQREWSNALFFMDHSTAVAGAAFKSLMLKKLTEFMEKRISSMKQHSLQPILAHLEHPTGEAQTDAAFRLVQMVARIMKDNKNRELSIDGIIQQLRDECGIHNSAGCSSIEPAPELRQGVFAMLGILTMSYETPSDPYMTHFQILEPETRWMSGTVRELLEAGDATGLLIRLFGTFHPKIPRLDEEPPTKKQSDAGPEELHVSVLNAHVLVMIGKATIEWSDLMSAHLSFNVSSKTLTLFRFPSFCALNYFPDRQRTLFDCIMDDWVRSAKELRIANKSMHKEILRSYRLLFGQDRRSRKLFNAQEHRKASTDGISDPLLEQLCGQARKASVVLEDDTFNEPDLYNAKFEFPFLGQRLNYLQEYAHSCTPHRIRDVWHDTRDPAKWLVVWAVTFFGVPALVLSFFQLVVVVYAAVKMSK